MKRLIAVAALAAAIGLAAPGAAHAETYLSKSQAQSDARDALNKRYGSARYNAYCRPQGMDQGQPGYVYTRWVCYWADNYHCEGTLVISGHGGIGWYRAAVARGQRCPAN